MELKIGMCIFILLVNTFFIFGICGQESWLSCFQLQGSTETKSALKEVKRPGDLGWLCIRTPFPGMAGGIYNSQDEFLTRYFEKFPSTYQLCN